MTEVGLENMLDRAAKRGPRAARGNEGDCDRRVSQCRVGAGTDTAVAHRTGQPQRISGIADRVPDLSAWAGIGPVQLTASGADTLVSTTIPAATAAITGVGIGTYKRASKLP